jgi:L-2-hydroxycarboxylate dehydrogenase (NAD+)
MMTSPTQQSTPSLNPPPSAISMKTLTDLTRSALLKLGYNQADSKLLSEILLYAEQRGSSQGLIKLTSGGMARDPRAAPPVYEATSFPSIGRIRGNWSHSMISTALAAKKAVELASSCGIGVVSVNEIHSSSGALGYYATQMAQAGYVGFLACNTLAKVAPFGAKTPHFGTNPFAIGLPTTTGNPLVFDMATSAVAWFDVLLHAQEGQSLSEGVAIDGHGAPTTDPKEALKGALLAFGGPKGSGLAMMIDLLAGAFVGAQSNRAGEPSSNWGALVIAARADLFVDQEVVSSAVEKMVKDVQSLEPVNGVCSVTVPGQRSDALAATRRDELILPAPMYTQLCLMSAGI